MRSLFWKIFLGFWLTVILAGLIMWLIATMTQPDEPRLLDRNLLFADKGLNGYVTDANAALQLGGLDGWKDYVHKLSPEEPRPFLFDRSGQTLLQQPAPRHVRRLARDIFKTGKVRAIRHQRQFAIGRLLQLPNGSSAALVLNLSLQRPRPGDAPPRPPHPRHAWFDQRHGLGILVFLLVAASICFLLTRSLTVPVGKLRRATQRFASGQLDTRIGADIRGGHELAELAGDFDRMAGRIETLVTGQQRLLRDISHELRSPLARMNIALELARQRAGQDASSALDKIGQESERLNEMIGELLTLNRLDTEPESLPMSELSLSQLVQQVAEDADFEANNRQIRVACDFDTEGRMEGSPELLLRAIDNIVRNAVRYSTEGSVISISLYRQDKEIVLSVRDQGPGVPDTALPHLFEPFYRVADDRDRASGGTGIGLAIAERAVTLHGGRISASNHPEGGLQIEIHLPQAR